MRRNAPSAFLLILENIVCPLAFKYIAVLVYVFSVAVAFVVQPIAFIGGSVSPIHNSVSCTVAVVPSADIFMSVCKIVSTLTVHFSGFPTSGIAVTAGIASCSVAFALIVYKITFVHGSVGICKLAVSVLYAVFPASDIFISRRI